MFEQEPFVGGGRDDFIENPSPRCPVALVLDVSHSMAGEKIRQLNQGLQTLKSELQSDDLAMKRAELSIITFGPVRVLSDFVTADLFSPPHLSTEGNTPMGEAVERAASLIEQRRQSIRSGGVGLYRPWMFLITDGGPTDNISRAADIVAEAERSKKFMMFAIGVDGANMDVLAQLSPAREPLMLRGVSFRELFQWLSASLSGVSRSQTDDAIALPSPRGWAQI